MKIIIKILIVCFAASLTALIWIGNMFCVKMFFTSLCLLGISILFNFFMVLFEDE